MLATQAPPVKRDGRACDAQALALVMLTVVLFLLMNALGTLPMATTQHGRPLVATWHTRPQVPAARYA